MEPQVKGKFVTSPKLNVFQIHSKEFTIFNQFQILNPECSRIFGPTRKVSTHQNLKSLTDLVRFGIQTWENNVMVSNQFILTYIV